MQKDRLKSLIGLAEGLYLLIGFWSAQSFGDCLKATTALQHLIYADLSELEGISSLESALSYISKIAPHAVISLSVSYTSGFHSICKPPMDMEVLELLWLSDHSYHLEIGSW